MHAFGRANRTKTWSPHPRREPVEPPPPGGVPFHLEFIFKLSTHVLITMIWTFILTVGLFLRNFEEVLCFLNDFTHNACIGSLFLDGIRFLRQPFFCAWPGNQCHSFWSLKSCIFLWLHVFLHAGYIFFGGHYSDFFVYTQFDSEWHFTMTFF